MNVVREITDAAPLRPEQGERREHCAYPEDRVVLYGWPDRHLNHSCDPNAYERYDDGAPVLCARRGIALGEEITVDYNVNLAGGESWPCSCGAGRCRGETIGTYFGLPRDVQREYLPLLADWFVAQHRERLDALRATDE